MKIVSTSYTHAHGFRALKRLNRTGFVGDFFI